MMPWLLAARSIAGHPKGRLSWLQLWHVLRWYAHNRGYDGNALWRKGGDEGADEDTQKVQNANALMERFGTSTMAETICAFLGVSLDSDKPKLEAYFKGSDVAFPRSVVVAEVETILRNHVGKLPGLDASLVELLLRDVPPAEKKHFRLPQRYSGGLLFGQMIPRFDNRIIPTCPITGEKTPSKDCREFYHFRWGMLIANIRVEGKLGGTRPLSAEERKALHARMEAAGRMTKKELRKAVEEITDGDAAALDRQFFSPETEKALVLDPVKVLLEKAPIANIWKLIPPKFQKIFASQIYKRGSMSLADWLKQLEAKGISTVEIRGTLESIHEASEGKRKKGSQPFEAFLNAVREPDVTSGRAPYSRKLLIEAFAEVLDGRDPLAAASPIPGGVVKDGCLARTQAVLDREAARDIDQLTNNHLVRQRIRMFQRLLRELYAHYANGDVSRIDKVTVEVARDMQEYSGKNAKEKAATFSSKARPFQQAEEFLKKNLEDAGKTKRISYSMIRKARIAIAQDWVCPYTGRRFSANEIAEDLVDIEHIIPHSKRNSNALEGLVVTFREVNRMKGNRSALEFIREFQGQRVSGMNGTEIWPESLYMKFVEGLDPKRDPRRNPAASDEDKIRWRRKQWLQLEKYDKREAEFTPGALTQTSHLNKLAALEARKFLRAEAEKAGISGPGAPEYRVGHIEGSVTHYFQSRWQLMGCLAKTCPDVLQRIGEETHLLPKAEIRNITHLHHAVDAIAAGLVRELLGSSRIERKVCEAILSRNPSKDQRQILEAIGLFGFDARGKHHLKDLPAEFLDSVSSALAERRVVQHVPRTMSGLRAEQTQWRVLELSGDGKVELAQNQVGKNGKRGRRIYKETVIRVLGLNPDFESKLKARKAGIVIGRNFGVALTDNLPVVIPFHQVWHRLKKLAAGNVMPTVLRAGDIIEIPQGRYIGTWRIHCINNNHSGVALDMAQPHLVKAQNKKEGCGMNVLLKSLIRSGMKVRKGTMIS